MAAHPFLRTAMASYSFPLNYKLLPSYAIWRMLPLLFVLLFLLTPRAYLCVQAKALLFYVLNWLYFSIYTLFFSTIFCMLVYFTMSRQPKPWHNNHNKNRSLMTVFFFTFISVFLKDHSVIVDFYIYFCFFFFFILFFLHTLCFGWKWISRIELCLLYLLYKRIKWRISNTHHTPGKNISRVSNLIK